MHTGVSKSLKSYVKWPGTVGEMAKDLEKNWSNGVLQNEKKSLKSESSHRNNHRSSKSTSPDEEEEEEEPKPKKRPHSKEHSSRSADHKKVKVSVDVVKSSSKKLPEPVAYSEEKLFDSPAVIKRVSSHDKPSSRMDNKQCTNGDKQQSQKKSSDTKTATKSSSSSGHSSKESRGSSGSSRSSDSKSSAASSKTSDSSKKSRVANVFKLPPGEYELPSLPKELNLNGPMTSEKSKKSSKSKDSSSKNKSTAKLTKAATEEGFDASIASFDECLGIPDYTRSVKKKKPSPVIPTPVMKVFTVAPSSTSSSRRMKETSSSASSSKSERSSSPYVVKTERYSPPLVPRKSAIQDTVLSSTLPEIQPNYKPLRTAIQDIYIPRPKKMNTEVSDGAFLISSRHNRTQVFSGRRQGLMGVPKLFDLCIKVLQENIDDISYTGLPYDVLQPVLEKCTAVQLFQLEYYNPHLVDDTGVLWEKHCEREFKGKQLDEHETWRDLYLRQIDERAEKLKRVTAAISASVAKSVPVRQTKMTGMDCPVKPPRNIARLQAKNGTSEQNIKAVSKRSTLKQQLAMPPPGADLVPAAPPPGTSSSGNSQQKEKAPVKKVAPLMQKALKSMKSRYRR